MGSLFAILAALQKRQRTGRGARMDSIPAGGVHWHPQRLRARLHHERPHQESASANRHLSRAPQGAYRCKGEDEWVAISAESDRHWEALCSAMGRTDLLQEPQYRHVLGRYRLQDEIDGLINAWTSGLGARDVMARLQEAGVPCGIVSKANDLFEDPHFKERGFFESHGPPVRGQIPPLRDALQDVEDPRGKSIPTLPCTVSTTAGSSAKSLGSKRTNITGCWKGVYRPKLP